MNRFKKWCKAERIGRAEEVTSQDMMPTNGGALAFGLLWGALWIMVALAICYEFGN